MIEFGHPDCKRKSVYSSLSEARRIKNLLFSKTNDELLSLSNKIETPVHIKRTVFELLTGRGLTVNEVI